MTDRWVSTSNHWCRYCKCFIRGTKAAIAHHEQGNRHKWGVINYNKDKNMNERETNKADSKVLGELAQIERVRRNKCGI
jgi:hypothetical protein